MLWQIKVIIKGQAEKYIYYYIEGTQEDVLY